jgi:hypothetical protein
MKLKADQAVEAVPAVTAPAALRANTRNRPSAYLGRNRVPRGGVELTGPDSQYWRNKILRICIRDDER